MSPFSPETWPFSLDLLPDEACLVGGSVRDQLLQRQASYLDLDFVLPSAAVASASAIARACGAGFVVLDDARQIARVVFDHMTVDFAQQQGESIEADLHRRDFTVNAIAYSPHRQTLIDPLGGKSDLSARTIRMVSAENLADDPLRLLRAYRQAAQLDFTLEPITQSVIASLAPSLQTVSAERIRSELDALLSVGNASTPQLTAVLQQQLLRSYLPQFTAASLSQLSAMEATFAQLENSWPEYAQRLKCWVKPVPAGFYRSWYKAAKLSCLLGCDSATASDQLNALKYSRQESQVVLTLLKTQPHIERLCLGKLTRSQQFFLFKDAGRAFPAVAFLALARGAEIALVKQLVAQYLDADDRVAHAQPLVTGTMLMKQLKLKPGPRMGKLLSAIEQAQAAGTIKTQSDAIAFAQSLTV
ncbi:MAG: CCA tRNA nucleotidyltransferase [Cyanobacteria bacterium J06597_16]